MDTKELIVVCGLARCGTSLLMKMLHQGGIEPFCDPPSLGYGYEYHATLYLPNKTEWLDNSEGKAVKILDPHRLRLPDDRPYAFILLTRDFREQAKSHVKFLKALGLSVTRQHRSRLEESLREDLPIVESLLDSYSQSRILRLPFERVIADPLGASTDLDDFLQRSDFDMLKAAQCVLRRSSKCLPYLLEMEAA
jgi:hypothetical protein